MKILDLIGKEFNSEDTYDVGYSLALTFDKNF